MKTTHYSLPSLTPSALQGIALGLLASGLIACQAFAVDDGTLPPQLSSKSGTLPPVPTSSGSISTANVPEGLSVSAGVEAKAAADSDVLAHIGNIDVKVGDVKIALQQLPPVKAYEIEQNPVAFRHLVESVALRQLLLNEAIAKHWDQKPDVASQVEHVKSTTITNSYLLELTKLPADYPGEDELKKIYEKAKQSLAIPHRFQLSQIFIAQPADADAAIAASAQVKLQAVLKKLQEPAADFAGIARSDSEDKASAAKGGEMGWLDDVKLPSLIRVRVIHLAKGAISEPIRINDGWHIVKVLDNADVSPVPYDQIKGILAGQLRAQRVQSDIENYLATRLKQNPVSIDDQELLRVQNITK
jgi:parvulin-like peptidyl-prolyl isomerase